MLFNSQCDRQSVSMSVESSEALASRCGRLFSGGSIFLEGKRDASSDEIGTSHNRTIFVTRAGRRATLSCQTRDGARLSTSDAPRGRRNAHHRRRNGMKMVSP